MSNANNPPPDPEPKPIVNLMHGRIETDGGATIQGDVNTGRDFIRRNPSIFSTNLHRYRYVPILLVVVGVVIAILIILWLRSI